MKKIKLTYSDEHGCNISEQHEIELSNILGTHTPIHFINCILFNKSNYSINAVKAIEAYNYLSKHYELPKY